MQIDIGIDAMTGALTRRHLFARHASPPFDGVLAFADVDRLSYANDTLGPSEVNEMLRTVAKISIELFGRDNVYRIMGDEFAVVLSAENAFARLDEWRRRVEEALTPQRTATYAIPASSLGTVEAPRDGTMYTLSIGFTEMAQHDSIEDAVAAADGAKYTAKTTRNSVSDGKVTWPQAELVPDPMTGALTRQHLYARASRAPLVGTLAVGDVDRIMFANRLLGFEEGDAMLRSVAQAAIELFGQADVYRLSGDEFVIWSTSPIALDGLEYWCTRIEEELAPHRAATYELTPLRPEHVPPRDFLYTLTVGYTDLARHGSFDKALGAAYWAQTKSKKFGHRNRVVAG